jgi:molecular chaperone DnaJ
LKSDPYKTLGVDRNASPAELKRVYRRLAMRWHPDRNDHPGATERFKEIRAAYDALLEPEDDAPDDDAPPDYPAEAEPTEQASETEQAADIRLNLEVSLVEAWSGCHKTIHFQRATECHTCGGSGEYGMTRTRFCSACHGSGRVRDKELGLVSCGECAGRGFFSERICPDCGGSGRDITEVSLQIKVPPGMLPGDDLRLAGQGEAGDGATQSGDLFLTIVIHTHPVFVLRGRDLCFEMPVNALALIAGSEVEIPLPLGNQHVQLDPGAALSRELRFAKKGYPGRGKAQAGDLLVTLKPIFPTDLNAKQRKSLQQLVESLNGNVEDCLPDIAVWQQKLRAEDSAEN